MGNRTHAIEDCGWDGWDIMTYTLLESWSREEFSQLIGDGGSIEFGSIDLSEEADRLWRDEDIAGLNMLAGCSQFYGPDGHALPETADYLWCPAVERLGIAWGAQADWLDAVSLDEGIQVWLSEEVTG